MKVTGLKGCLMGWGHTRKKIINIKANLKKASIMGQGNLYIRKMLTIGVIQENFKMGLEKVRDAIDQIK